MKIKLCGLKRPEDIKYVNEFLPDYGGFVFAKSKRQVTPGQAAELGGKLAGSIKRVGIFVNEEPDIVAGTAKTARLDVIQLHGDEDQDYIGRLKEALKRAGIQPELWKAIRVKDADSISQGDSLTTDKLLFDAFTKEAYGGTGKEADWSVIRENKPQKPFFLAGGLHIGNIRQGVAQTQPYGVDISSGIETDGVKDREKIKAIVTLLRSL